MSWFDSPVRKLFACELQTLIYNAEKDCCELKIDGKIIDARVVWLQGYLSRDRNSGDGNWLFSDGSSAGLPIAVPGLIEVVDEKRYYSIVAAPVFRTPVSNGENMGSFLGLQVKKIVNLNKQHIRTMSEEDIKTKNDMLNRFGAKK